MREFCSLCSINRQYSALANQTAHLLVVAVPALDLALAAALEVLLHLDLHADLVALVRVQRTPS